MTAECRLRLVNTARWRASGLVRVASSSDGIVDVAAAAELGLIENVGLVSLLSLETRARARDLLKTNFLYPIKVQRASLWGRSSNAHVLALVREALPEVIGPMYFEVKVKNRQRPETALSRKAFAFWVKAEIENGRSELNKRLNQANYADICGVERSIQWWERLL